MNNMERPTTGEGRALSVLESSHNGWRAASTGIAAIFSDVRSSQTKPRGRRRLGQEITSLGVTM